MTQTAPEPAILYDLVDKLAYRPGWTFTVEFRHARGLPTFGVGVATGA